MRDATRAAARPSSCSASSRRVRRGWKHISQRGTEIVYVYDAYGFRRGELAEIHHAAGGVTIALVTRVLRAAKALRLRVASRPEAGVA